MQDNQTLEQQNKNSGVPTMLLLVILRPLITFAKLNQDPASTIWVDTKRFHKSAFGDWGGFYDWLRSSSGQIIGLRYWPFEEAGFLYNLLDNLSYMKGDEKGRYINIYFTGTRDFDIDRSDDQAFGGNYLFSGDGEWCISFDLRTLTPAEIASINMLDVQWEIARGC